LLHLYRCYLFLYQHVRLISNEAILQ
jgi:hypothetical protein